MESEYVEGDSVVTEYFEQFALAMTHCTNIPTLAIYKISQLGRWYYEITARILEKYRRIYYKFAPKLARAQLRRLIAQPVEYIGNITRVASILELQGYQGGVRILDAEQPLFTDDFLRDYRPALTNICILMNAPAEFFYKIGIARKGVLRSGAVTRADIIELEPRLHERGVNAMGAEGNADAMGAVGPADAILPGRYFVDLQLGLDVNPLLFHPGTFYINEVLFAAARELMWIDAGGAMEPVMNPDIRVVIDHFTHVIAHFKIARAIDLPDGLVTDISDPRHRALVHFQRPTREEIAESVLTFADSILTSL